MISSVAMMLEITLNFPQAAKQINTAIDTVLNAGIRTADIVHHDSTAVSTSEMRDYIIESFKENVAYSESLIVEETVKE